MPTEDDERLHGVLRQGIDQGCAAGELRQFTHERARPVRDDRCAWAGLMTLADLDAAR